MLYLEDYLELIEHLPQELRDRLTYIRESDLKVNNSSLQLEAKVKKFFAEAKNLSQEQKQCEYEEILDDYEKTMKTADDKVHTATQTHDIMVKLVQKLDTELEKFKLELEADHAGITEELEKRSLELDADTRLDNTINNHLNNHNHHGSISHYNSNHNYHNRVSSGIKDRRRSEYKHRHHPYRNNHDNGYHGRDRLSHQQHEYSHTASHHYRQTGGKHAQQQCRHQSRQNSTASSPTPYGASLSSLSAPASVSGDLNGLGEGSGGHYSGNLASFGNNAGFRDPFNKSINNLPFSQQHSALSAALSSSNPTTPLNSVSALAMNNASSVHNKISNQTGLKGSDLIDPNNPLVRQNPLAAAASQAIAATQQLQQGRRTLSLKASFAAINAAGLAGQLESLGNNNRQEASGGNRNALAPMAPDQQAFRYNQYGRRDAYSDSNPLYISVTKSGRTTKRPKHHASHLYPDESPTSISSDNSVFENSESLSSTDFIESGTNFGSTSPSSLDFNGSRAGQGNTTLYHRDETEYCICRQISYGEMVACDNEDCEIEWFHYGCVGVTQPPKGKWYCPDCTRKMSSQHNNSQAQTQQKKRGRKEKSLFNLVNSLETSVKSKERGSEQSKSIV